MTDETQQKPWEIDYSNQAPTSEAKPWEVDWSRTSAPKQEKEQGDFSRGLGNTFKQLPQLGYGLLAGSGSAMESIFGEGGFSSGVKKAGVKGYKEWGDKLTQSSKASDEFTYSYEKAKEGDFGALIDWLQYGLGYAAGQGVQALVTGGVGKIVGQAAIKGTVGQVAEKMVAKEVAEIAASSAGKELSEEAIKKLAISNVAGSIGQTAAIGAQAFGMEGGEIFGDLASRSVDENRALTSEELARAAVSTLFAGGLEFVGDKVGLDLLLGKSPLLKPAAAMEGIKGRLARGAIAATGAAPIEGGTEYAQTLIEEAGKGNDPFSSESLKQAKNAAALGVVGGVSMGGIGGLINSPTRSVAKETEPAQEESVQADPLFIENKSDPYIAFPDGSVGKQSEVDQYIKSLPEDQQNAARAALLGYKPEPIIQETPVFNPQLLENKPDPYIVFPDGSVGKRDEVDAYINSLPEADRIPARAALLGYGAQKEETYETPESVISSVTSAATVDDAISQLNKIVSSSGNNWQKNFTFDANDLISKVGDSDVVVQNRNRNTASSVVQINSIAANPDYNRLSISRDFGNGAPFVFSPMNPPARIAWGKEDFAVAADGRKIPFRYAVVSANDVVSSNNADGTPRPEYKTGVDGAFTSVNNGRMTGLQEAFRRNTAIGYSEGLTADDAHGVDPKEISSIPNAVLTRVMARDQVTPDIGDLSNTRTNADLSPIEQAANDSRRINIAALSFDDNGVSQDSIRQFVNSIPATEANGLRNPDGSPTRQANDRVMAAVFHSTYENPDLVALYAQATDPEAKNILNAMAMAAPTVIKTKDTGDFDIRGLIADAAQVAVNAKRNGAKLSDFIKNQDFTLNPETLPFVEFIAENIRSPKKISEGFDALAQAMVAAHNASSQDSMFETIDNITRGDVLNKFRGDYVKQNEGSVENTGGTIAGQVSSQQTTANTGSETGIVGSQAKPVSATTEQEGFSLESETPDQARSRLAAKEKSAAAVEAANQQFDATQKQAGIAKEIAARQDASAENFQLGQSAEDSLAGQGDIFKSRISEQSAPFRNKSDANIFRVKNGINGTPKQTELGWRFEPNLKSSDREKLATRDAVNRLNKAFGKGGEKVAPVFDAPSVEHALAKELGRAFGIDVHFVSANDSFDGVAHNGKVFLSSEMDVQSSSPELAIAGHEMLHVLEQENPVLGAKMRNAISQYLKDGVIDARRLRESRLSKTDVSESTAAGEVMADINGAMWLDAKFWRELRDADRNLFRQAAYMLMETLTKAIKVFSGSRFDASTFVTDVDAVRKILVQVWTERNQIGDLRNSELDSTSIFSRKDRIEVDGVDRPTTNSNGKPLATTEEGIRNFWRWFGDSKALDKKGRPLIVFHGSPSLEITRFNDSDSGLYFTNKEFVAEGYKGRFLKRDLSGSVTQAYLALENPLVIDAKGKRNTNIPVPWAEWEPVVFGRRPKNAVSVEDAFKYAIENGHDGLIVHNVMDNQSVDENTKSTAYVVKTPTQIKSATGNNGEFSSDNSDIRFSRKENFENLKDVWKSIGESEDTFKYPKSKAKDWNDLLVDFGLGDYRIEEEAFGSKNDPRWIISAPKDDWRNTVPVIISANPREKSVWINTAFMREGDNVGARFYQMVADWAKNNDYTFVGDPDGLSDTALRRRTEQMLASALKHGTTDHLMPHDRQVNLSVADQRKTGVRPLDWSPFETDHNIKEMLQTVHENLLNVMPDASKLSYNEESGKYYLGDKELDNASFFELSRSAEARRANAGITTLKRAAIANSILSGEMGAYRGSDIRDNSDVREGGVDNAARDPRNRGLGEISYSRKEQVESPEFKKWFGKSKVVDDNGDPLVVYHGTSGDISFFDKLSLGASTDAPSSKKAFFFSSSPKVATGYALLSESRPGLKSKVLENASKSHILSDELKTMLAEESKKFSPQDIKDSEWVGNSEIKGMTGANILPVYLSLKNPLIVDYAGSQYREQSFNSILRKAAESGHDGAIFKNAEDSMHKDYVESSDIYAVFKPEQIKSAVGNNGEFDPNNPDIRYSRKDKEGNDRDLVITHNLTVSNLIHADKMGGIAVPSLAVTKKSSPLANFGEITLIGGKDMADPRGYAKTKVFGADIYSPRYPTVEYDISRKSKADAEKRLANSEKATGSHIDWSDIEKYGVRSLEDSPVMIHEYLESKGIEPNIVYEKAVNPERLQELKDQGFGKYLSVKDKYELGNDPEFQKKAAETKIAYYEEKAKEHPAFQEFADKLRGDEYEQVRVARDLASEVSEIARKLTEPLKADRYATRDSLRKQVEGDQDFKDYVQQFMGDIGANERIFKGYSSSGNRTYQPHTLENVVKMLKKELRGGEGFNYGVGSLRAKFTPEFKSIAEIRANKERLTSADNFKKVKDEIDNDFFALGEKIGVKRSETLISILEDAPKIGLDRAAKYYGIELGESAKEDAVEFLTRLKNLPTEYFEAKILRDVSLSEFSGAVVPKDAPKQAFEILQKNGVPIREYESEDDRAKAIESFADELHSSKGEILFSRKETIVGDNKRERTPEQLRAFKNVGRTVEVPTLKERWDKLTNNLGKKLAQGIVDQFAPVKELSENAYMLMRLSKGASGAFEAMLKGGQLKLSGGVYDFDDQKRGGVIDRLLVPLQGEADDFMWWVAGNRAERLAMKGKERLFSPEDISAFKSLADGDVAFDYTIQHGNKAGQKTRNRKEIYKDSLITFNEFNKNTLDMAEQSGLIDGESRKHWEDEFYVPFYRVSEESEDGIRGMNIKSGVVRQQAFKKLKGGADKLNSDLLENTMMNWAHLLDAAAKNRAAKATLEAAQVAGIAEETDSSTKKTVWFMDGDKKRYFLVEDAPVLAAIQGLEFAGMRGPLMDAMSAMKHAMTMGVTASPFFKVRNLIRDSVSAIGLSELSYNPLKNIKEGYVKTDPKSDDYFRLLAGGGTIHFGSMLEGSESKRVRKLVESGVDESTILRDEGAVKAFYRKSVAPMIDAYNELGNRGESINRAALYDQLRKQGKSHAEASLMARDLMDFSMQGAWSSVRFLTQVVPFMNARLQGLYKLGRSAKEDPRRFANVLGGVAMASVTLMLIYGDDDDWKKREDWDRDNFWWFKVGGVAYRIPKPFEIGAIGTLAERGVEYFASDEMTGQRFKERFISLISENLSMNPIPQMVKPILDVYSNKDAFTGRPIETLSMERLQSDYRFNGTTSIAARAMSTAGNTITNNHFLSPVQVDHMIRGYFGWLGSFVVGASDKIVRPMMNEPTAATPDYWKVATGGLVADTKSAPSRYVTQMYDQAKVLEEAYGTWQMLMKTGKVEEAREFAQDNMDQLRKYKSVESIKRAESKLNEKIRVIERSSLSSDEKRERIQEIKDKKDAIARMAS